MENRTVLDVATEITLKVIETYYGETSVPPLAKMTQSVCETFRAIYAAVNEECSRY